MGWVSPAKRFRRSPFRRQENNNDILPDYYRAPEALLKSNWAYRVDIWSVSLIAWDIVGGHTLIDSKPGDGIWDDGAHIAELVALLGPPQQEFMRKQDMSWVFWDESSRWKDLIPTPDRSLEKLGTNQR
ncbi:hypothetical protein BBP40_005010 [Aspergillus hancockii]|nr:hypothetical protein BBP40_005010 [Aspergillus hancockii]